MINISQMELIESFLLETDSASKSVEHITMNKYGFVINHFWKPLAENRFKKQIHELNRLELKQIRYEMQNKTINEITLKKDPRYDKKFAPASIINYFSILSAYFEFLIKEEYITENPVRKMRIPVKPQRNTIYLTDEEINELVFSLNEKRKEIEANPLEYKRKIDFIQDMFIFLLPLTTGLRVYELSMTDLDSIDTKTGIVNIIGKGNKERISFIPLHDQYFMELYEALLNERRERIDRIIAKLRRIQNNAKIDRKNKIEARISAIERNKSIFINNRGLRLGIRDIQRKVQKYINEFEISKHITPHKLRHSFASKLVREDVDIFTIKEMMGHTNIKTTEIYLHSDSSSITKKMMNKKPFQFKIQ